MGDGLTADGIILIVEGDENSFGIAKIIDGGVPREEKVPREEHKVQEGPELDHTTVAGALHVFIGPQA